MFQINGNLDICKLAITRNNDEFVVKIANTCLTEILWPMLLSPRGCQLLPPCRKLQGVKKGTFVACSPSELVNATQLMSLKAKGRVAVKKAEILTFPRIRGGRVLSMQKVGVKLILTMPVFSLESLQQPFPAFAWPLLAPWV